MPDGGAAPRRDDRSFEDYVADRGMTLLRTAVFLTGDRQAGEDLLQDVLLRVYRRWRHIDDPDSYLRRSLANGAVSRARRRLTARENLVDWDDPDVDDPAGPADEAAQATDRHDLLAALRQLTARQRAVIVLRYFGDLPEAQIAAELGCAPSSVKTHTARGLLRLRALLGPGAPALPPLSPSPKGATA
ncbi:MULTISPECIES: SigE family RNA polymerase sigma factor [unclassified Pseudofrankia]|uniref:SigE family RNA polymerase sigma factor n=1 Tax=unclassified Pseudofrankia TaxID=2994372 RepID=UPI0008D9F835|nr:MULTISPECIES: SigE family RNA polymerase sigma factor [unclassified Pseudofrankia]MDT3441592.1 SigE family RNA polymerase sigma factor [Pseudofrankia sp. BMG5.37]OHV45538.1 RNA polymerase subunit sigma-24 [Pseudofrankia sp. BMG5.36]